MGCRTFRGHCGLGALTLPPVAAPWQGPLSGRLCPCRCLSRGARGLCGVVSPAPRGRPFVTAAAPGAVVLGAAVPGSGKAQLERQARALRGEPWDRAPRPRERRPVPVCAPAFPGAAQGGLSSSVLSLKLP